MSASLRPWPALTFCNDMNLLAFIRVRDKGTGIKV